MGRRGTIIIHIILGSLPELKKEARQVNQKFFEFGNIGKANMHKKAKETREGWLCHDGEMMQPTSPILSQRSPVPRSHIHNTAYA